MNHLNCCRSLAVGLALAGLIGSAFAAGSSATLTWQHPTQNTDHSALTLAEIKETVLTWRRPGSQTVVGTMKVAAPATTVLVNGLTCGDFNFTAATIVKANNVSSDETASVLYPTGVTCKPNPPGGLGAS